jgi:hypothetical protein
MPETRLWYNGRVFTGRQYAEALLIDQGRVVAAGSVDAVRRSAPAGTEAVDLQGKLVIPGLIDSHLHVAELTHAREGLEVGNVRSVPDLIVQVRRWAEDHPTGAVVGRGWDAERLGRGAWPTREELDEAVADRPLVLYHASGHAAVVNSATLATVGVDRTTRDPHGGRVGRTKEGEPDGALYEEAMRWVSPLTLAAHPPDPKALERTFRHVASLGITTVAAMNVGREEATALRELAGGHRLLVRVRTYLRLSSFEEILGTVGPRGQEPDYLAVTGVKGFTDGAFGPRTAWLSSPYEDAPFERGLPTGTDEELSAELSRAVDRGLAPALHAIGDRAVERALRLLRPLVGRSRAPLRIEHAGLTPPELFPLLDRVRPVLGVQPGFIWSDSWLAARLGRDRARWAYAFRTLSDRGHLLAGSSDAPYDPVDPWRGMSAAVHRRDPEGRSANPETAEAIPSEGAIQMYTVNGGLALGEPDLGRLEPGARADLVVLDALDLSRAFTRGSPGVLETWVNGARVFDAVRSRTG